MNAAAEASANPELRKKAQKVMTYQSCKVFDFEDGSFLTVWKTGRTEVNSLTSEGALRASTKPDA